MYIPFSQKNPLPNESFAEIANYLERDMGWDLEYLFKNNIHYFKNKTKTGYSELLGIHDYNEGNIIHMRCYFLAKNGAKALFDDMNFIIFKKSYKSILPATRDFLGNTN